MEKLQKHVACAIAYIIVPNKDIISMLPACVNKYKVFIGCNCIQEYLQSLEGDAKDIFNWNKINTNLPMEKINNLKQLKCQQTACSLCEKLFKEDGDKFADHNHYNGKFRNIVCQECNNKLIINKWTLPIVFHNFKNYDCHLLCIQGFGKMQNWRFNVIPQTSERYIATVAKFEVDKRAIDNKPIYFHLKFLDSCQFLMASLQSLVEKLPRTKFVLLQKHMGGDYDWMFKKGIFPYSWFDSWEKLKYNRFPIKMDFYDSLTDSLTINDEDYERACNTYLRTGCFNFQQYMELYLKCDVLQLADVFENFREMCLNDDGLDPINYFTIPQLTWDSAFKSTKCHLHLLTDVDMYNFFEQGIRGGMVFVNKHFVATNHESLIETYNRFKSKRELLYVDANNLYGHALSMKLPQSDFQWMTSDEMQNINWNTIDTESEWGYTLEVNLLYPQSIHDKSQDLPFAPEKLCVNIQHCII